MMKSVLHCPIENVAPLLPHSGRMILLDKITEYSHEHLRAETTIRPDNILIQNNELSCLSGIEIMAQGIAAWAGCMAHEAGEAVRLGFLLGTRKLNLFATHIPIGATLAIDVRVSTQDASGMGVFDCELHRVDTAEKTLLLQAALNVFSPKNQDEIQK